MYSCSVTVILRDVQPGAKECEEDRKVFMVYVTANPLSHLQFKSFILRLFLCEIFLQRPYIYFISMFTATCVCFLLSISFAFLNQLLFEVSLLCCVWKKPLFYIAANKVITFFLASFSVCLWCPPFPSFPPSPPFILSQFSFTDCRMISRGQVLLI